MEILVLITLLITIFSHLGCPHHFLIGDEFCNDLTNNVECNYDGGDCCVDINNEFCTDCTCYLIENCAAGFTPSVVGDGFCNDETNSANCNYDGGDCCGYTVNTDFCSDCICHFNETCAAGTHPLVGDGFCNDETNNENCNYDGGECCSTCTSTSKCAECACLSGTDDTCHSKPNSFYYSHFSNGVHTSFFYITNWD